MKPLNRLLAALVAVSALSWSLQASAQQSPLTGTVPSPNSTVVPALISENGLPILLIEDEGQRATFNYAVQAFSPVATPTAFVVVQGSATKVVRIKKIRVGGVATANGNMQLQIQRWSTAGTLGSAVLTGLTAVKQDVNDVAATAVVSTVGTANYTTQGTGSTIPLVADRVCLATTATGTPCPITFDFSTRSDKPLTLRGTSDYIVLSGNGSAVPSGGALDIQLEVEEDTN